MRKSMAVISVFIIGIGACSSEIAAMAALNEEGSVRNNNLLKENILGEGYSFGEEIIFETDLKENSNLLDTGNMNVSNLIEEEKAGPAEKISDDEEKESVKENPKEKSDESISAEMLEIENLQIPQKFEIVIDPWEMDGKIQIYSEQYTIKNTGETTGVLTLSQLTCKPQEKSGVVVRTDKNGLHDNEEKSVYMELVFGNGDLVVLSEEEAEYTAELKPDEELPLWFAGEVNEYAADGWENGDVTVGVVYSWEEGNIMDSMNEEIVDQTSDINKDPMNEADADGEGPAAFETPDEEEMLPQIDEFAFEQKVGENEEKAVKTVNLQAIQKSKMVIDSWMIGENGQENQFVSEEYVLRNTGETAGTLILGNLRCKTQELSEIAVQTDKDGLYSSEEKAVCVEMALGNGEKIVLSEENSEYQIELKPGEEFSIRFMGEMNESGSEELEEDIVEVTAICSWSM